MASPWDWRGFKPPFPLLFTTSLFYPLFTPFYRVRAGSKNRFALVYTYRYNFTTIYNQSSAYRYVYLQMSPYIIQKRNKKKINPLLHYAYIFGRLCLYYININYIIQLCILNNYVLTVKPLNKINKLYLKK